MAPRRMRGEDGASLLIALGFLALFGLLIPAILTLGGTNLLDTNRLHEQRGGVYNADGALDGAIQYLRQPAKASCGRPFAPACTFTTELNGTTATVNMVAKGAVLDLDRTVDLTASFVGTTKTATATVIVRDSSLLAVPPVDVKLWRSLRSPSP